MSQFKGITRIRKNRFHPVNCLGFMKLMYIQVEKPFLFQLNLKWIMISSSQITAISIIHRIDTPVWNYFYCTIWIIPLTFNSLLSWSANRYRSFFKENVTLSSKLRRIFFNIFKTGFSSYFQVIYLLFSSSYIWRLYRTFYL